MTTSPTSLTPPENLTLNPPEVVAPPAPVQSNDMVPLKPEQLSRVNTQLDGFVQSLLTEDLESQSFKEKLDSAFRLGRKEIADSSMLSGHFMEKNFKGAEDSPAFKTIQELREQFEELNPKNEGNLLEPAKLFGLIPFGDKLKRYFRKYESAADQIKTLMTDLNEAQDEVRRDAAEIETAKTRLWESMQKLKMAIAFAEQLDARIKEEVDRLKPTDPQRSRALEQEVLFYARQNVQDMYTQQQVNVFGYLAMETLKKTARELIIGCDRVATTGMSALAVAQTVARATGNQVQVMNMLKGVNDSIGDLLDGTARQLEQHVQRTGEMAAQPLIGMEKLQSMFDQTFRAMDAMDNFRSAAIDSMGKNIGTMKGMLEKAEAHINRSKVGAEAGRQAMQKLDDGGGVAL
ncbi:toxic anion resistance protein [Parachitinimonas caeni]|uniref:Toxic anion resistance protein n=1 Tax=Parachitinimonas caeni TaxID=3031301 RepID=A0ABT7E3A7_9NEIS|nr:toxic anion resistance protein [Parachitinimonas caeni]MDK2126785.1 toxic anion resistance protein [Parachitinimonas caeni]